MKKLVSRIGVRCLALSFIFVFLLVASVVTSWWCTSSQFRVVYSLDRRQNDLEIIRLIDQAKDHVYFAIYYFTKEDIADALVRAKKRGITVWGITDREAALGSNERVVKKIRSAGIPLEVEKHKDGIMHIKALVTEKAYASGSYNWTDSATESNDEILEIGTNRRVRAEYERILKRVLMVNK